MTIIQKTKIQNLALLGLGVLLVAGAHMSLGIGMLAWVSFVPFLLFIKRNKGVKAWLGLGTALFLGWSLAVGKIITDPIPAFFIPVFSLPIALWQLGVFGLYARLRKMKGVALLFPALMVLGEWAQWQFSPLASWGAMAYTQVENLPLLQSVSLFGMAGLGFLIYWVNVWIERHFFSGQKNIHATRITLAVVTFVFVFGSLRLAIAERRAQKTMKVAAVSTDCDLGGLPLPEAEVRDQWAENLFDRTRKAAASGARIVVWNEGGYALWPEEEAEWEERLGNLANETKVDLYASYIVPISVEPFLYENKFLHFRPDGALQQTYLKHYPVAGEPAVKGTSPLMITEIDGIKTGGAICYDYDYPSMGRGYGKLNADLVVVPSSDWRGIDPVHTQMATLRAIENGHSLLRSTRFGLSAGVDPYGRILGQLSYFDSEEKVLITRLPVKGTRTIYTFVGEAFLGICGLLVLSIPFYHYVGKRRKQGEV